MLAALLGGARAVELDLAVDLRAVEDGALHDVGIVGRELVLHRGEVRDGAAHRRRAPPAPAVRRAARGRPRSPRAPRASELVGNDPVEPELLGEPHGADVHAEPLVDPSSVAERELRAAAAGVEHDAASPRPRPSPEIAATYASRASSSPEITSTSTPERARTASTNAALFGGDPQPGRSDRRDRLDPAPLRLLAMPAIASTVRSIALGLEPPGLLEALAEPRDLGAVDDRPPRAVGAPLAEVELDRVRADVDDGEPPRAEAERAP